MDRGEILRNPMAAAFVGAVLTYLFLFVRIRVTGAQDPPNSYYFKPAFLNAILVYIIVRYGQYEA